MEQGRSTAPGRHRVALACLLLAALAAAPAAADKERARALFAEGGTLFEAGRFSEAAAAFRSAYDIAPHWKLFYNIGQCDAAARNYGLALEAFERYLAEGGDEIGSERRDEVLAEVERLRKMVGMLAITAPDGAAVIVNGIERDRTPVAGPIPVAAGITHELVIRLGELVLLERQVRVSGGQTVEIATRREPGEGADDGAEPREDDPAGEGDGHPAAPDDSGGIGLATWGWIATGIGGALLVSGAVTGGMALSLNRDLEQGCPGGACSEEHWDDNDRMGRLAVATNVLLGAGAAAAAAGVVMLIVNAAGDRERDEPAVALLLGPASAGIGIRGRF